MLDKSKLGKRYTCHECGTKFYDLNRPKPVCPDCDADPSEAPIRDISLILSKSSMARPAAAPSTAVDSNPTSDDDKDFADVDGIDEIDEVDDMGSFGDLDMDDED